MLSEMKVAEIAHEANRALRRVIGEDPGPGWNEAPDEMKDSTLHGVQNLAVDPGTQHEAWVAHKLEAGWKHGPVKDPEARTHPCLVPYDDLPEEQRIKDHLFQAIVKALKPRA